MERSTGNTGLGFYLWSEYEKDNASFEAHQERSGVQSQQEAAPAPTMLTSQTRLGAWRD